MQVKNEISTKEEQVSINAESESGYSFFDDILDISSKIPEEIRPVFNLITRMITVAIEDCIQFGKGGKATIEQIEATDFLFHSESGSIFDLSIDFLDEVTHVSMTTATVRESLLRQPVVNAALNRLNAMYDDKLSRAA